MTDTPSAPPHFIHPTVAIIAAFVGSNAVQVQELPKLIGEVHTTLKTLAAPPVVETPEPQKPAVPISKSITPDYLVCLMDGKRFRSLKRHLKSRYGMTPDDYRTKWGLPHDYPMVAPGYARERSKLAKAMGLGQLRRRKPA